MSQEPEDPFAGSSFSLSKKPDALAQTSAGFSMPQEPEDSFAGTSFSLPRKPDALAQTSAGFSMPHEPEDPFAGTSFSLYKNPYAKVLAAAAVARQGPARGPPPPFPAEAPQARARAGPSKGLDFGALLDFEMDEEGFDEAPPPPELFPARAEEP